MESEQTMVPDLAACGEMQDFVACSELPSEVQCVSVRPWRPAQQSHLSSRSMRWHRMPAVPQPKHAGQTRWDGEQRHEDWKKFPGGRWQVKGQKAKLSHPIYNSLYRLLQSFIFHPL